MCAKTMGNAFRAAFFGKVADPQSAISSQKYTPLQISFNWLVNILESHPSK